MTELATRIAAIFASEDHAAKVTKASQVPTSYNAITVQWLTAVLCPAIEGAHVTGFRFDARDDGSSNRRRIFVEYDEAGRRAGLPATVFCKAAEALNNRLVLGISGAALNETNFYNLVRPRLEIEAPVGIWAALDPENYASLIMLRDLGPAVRFCDERTDVNWNKAASQMETLARLHSRFYESPALGSAELPYSTWPIWWRNMMDQSTRFEESCDTAFGDSFDLMPERLRGRRAEIWPATEWSVERHNALPKTLIHCDVHLKNWYIADGDNMGLSDWQIATIGHWSRDVIYTITSALTVENRRRWEKDLVLHYLDQMASRGVPMPGADETWAELLPQLMTALAFWTITLHPAPGMPDMQPERTTHAFLRRLYAAIDDHEVLDRIPS